MAQLGGFFLTKIESLLRSTGGIDHFYETIAKLLTAASTCVAHHFLVSARLSGSGSEALRL